VRDIALVLFIFGMVPVMIKRPWIGVMMWIWISVMTPHAFAWGLASQMRIALVAGAATLIGLVVTRDRVKLPINTTTVLLILFPLWMTITLMFAFNFDEGVVRYLITLHEHEVGAPPQSEEDLAAATRRDDDDDDED